MKSGEALFFGLSLICLTCITGADVETCTKEGDGALYLATFGALSTPGQDASILEDLFDAGTRKNAAQQFCQVHNLLSEVQPLYAEAAITVGMFC